MDQWPYSLNQKSGCVIISFFKVQGIEHEKSELVQEVQEQWWDRQHCRQVSFWLRAEENMSPEISWSMIHQCFHSLPESLPVLPSSQRVEEAQTRIPASCPGEDLCHGLECLQGQVLQEHIICSNAKFFCLSLTTGQERTWSWLSHRTWELNT